ncbi:hypothetical protein [Brevundimonas sp.]
MVGEILYFLHRHVRVATPIAVVLFAAFVVMAVNLLGQVGAMLTR